MDILKKEIINKNSPMWIGFQHALLTMLSIWIFLAVLSITWPDFFGFYFSTVRQEFMIVIVSTLLGTLFSAVVLFWISKKAENPQGILKASVVWFIIFQISLLFITFISSPGIHYGKTAVDNLLETLPPTIIMIIEFSLLSGLFLRRKINGVNISH